MLWQTARLHARAHAGAAFRGMGAHRFRLSKRALPGSAGGSSARGPLPQCQTANGRWRRDSTALVAAQTTNVAEVHGDVPQVSWLSAPFLQAPRWELDCAAPDRLCGGDQRRHWQMGRGWPDLCGRSPSVGAATQGPADSKARWGWPGRRPRRAAAAPPAGARPGDGGRLGLR